MRSLLTTLMNHGAFLVAGALVGVTLTGCPGPKQIGEESDTNINEMCMDGDMKPADDGCNTCVCSEGNWACTEKGCNNEDPPPPAECEEGDEKLAPDGCNTCTCYEGAWACTQLGCVNTTTDPSETATYGETGETFGSTTVMSDGESSVGDTESGACGDGELGGAEECDDGNMADGDGCSADCTLEGDACLDNPQDPLQVLAAKIEVDTLVVDVSYGGGCETHDIGYCWDGSFAESDPVQTWLDVWHDGHQDPCDAIVEEQRMLDLTQLKTAWQAGYQQEHGEIIVHLEGWGEDLLYTF